MSERANGTRIIENEKLVDGYISIRVACESNANPLPR